jgi:hypothetical protein
VTIIISCEIAAMTTQEISRRLILSNTGGISSNERFVWRHSVYDDTG